MTVLLKEAPSGQRSYLPVIDRPIDNTALNAYMTCAREFFMSMVLNRRPEGKSIALRYGTLWHTLLEWHYKTGGDMVEAIARAELSWDGDEQGDYRTLARLESDYEDYIQKWGTPDREIGQTIGFPEEPMVEISLNAGDDDLLHPYAGKLDRFVEIEGQVYVEDHKTTSRLDKNYFSQFDLSNQMMGYTFLGQKLLPSRKVVGVRVNVIHTLTKETGFHRQLFTFSDERIREWKQNYNAQVSRVAREYEMWLSGDFTVLGDGKPIAFPGHYGDNGCSRKFGLCGYNEVCSRAPRYRQQILENEYPVNPWNPLEDIDD